MTDEHTPSELFMLFFDRDTLINIAKSIKEAYKQSFDYCSEMFDKEQMHDLLPNMRRATIERNVLHKLKNNKKNIKAVSSPNAITNCYHVKVISGHASLTFSAVKSPKEMVRDALFRKQYAHDNDIILFPDIYEDQELDNNVYGILLHGPSSDNLEVPGFMVVKFPNRDLKDYLKDEINLIEMLTESTVEDIKEPQVGGLRTREEQGEKEAQ